MPTVVKSVDADSGIVGVQIQVDARHSDLQISIQDGSGVWRALTGVTFLTGQPPFTYLGTYQDPSFGTGSGFECNHTYNVQVTCASDATADLSATPALVNCKATTSCPSDFDFKVVNLDDGTERQVGAGICYLPAVYRVSLQQSDSRYVYAWQLNDSGQTLTTPTIDVPVDAMHAHNDLVLMLTVRGCPALFPKNCSLDLCSGPEIPGGIVGAACPTESSVGVEVRDAASNLVDTENPVPSGTPFTVNTLNVIAGCTFAWTINDVPRQNSTSSLTTTLGDQDQTIKVTVSKDGCPDVVKSVTLVKAFDPNSCPVEVLLLATDSTRTSVDTNSTLAAGVYNILCYNSEADVTISWKVNTQDLNLAGDTTEIQRTLGTDDEQTVEATLSKTGCNDVSASVTLTSKATVKTPYPTLLETPCRILEFIWMIAFVVVVVGSFFALAAALGAVGSTVSVVQAPNTWWWWLLMGALWIGFEILAAHVMTALTVWLAAYLLWRLICRPSRCRQLEDWLWIFQVALLPLLLIEAIMMIVLQSSSVSGTSNLPQSIIIILAILVIYVEVTKFIRDALQVQVTQNHCRAIQISENPWSR